MLVRSDYCTKLRSVERNLSARLRFFTNEISFIYMCLRFVFGFVLSIFSIYEFNVLLAGELLHYIDGSVSVMEIATSNS